MAGRLDIQHLVFRIVLSHHNLSVSLRPSTLRRKVQKNQEAVRRRDGTNILCISCSLAS